MSAEPQPGEVWMEADGCLLCRSADGDWYQFGSRTRVADDAPLLAHPLTRLLTADGRLVDTTNRGSV